MKYPAGIALLFIIISMFVTGCRVLDSSSEGMSDMTSFPSTDRDALMEMFNQDEIPQPESVQWLWREQGASSDRVTVPGPTDAYLLATLTFNQDVTSFLDMSQYTKLSDDFRVDESFIRDWFSADIKAAFEADGGYYAITPTRYDAAPVLEYPLQSGYFFAAGNIMFIYARNWRV